MLAVLELTTRCRCCSSVSIAGERCQWCSKPLCGYSPRQPTPDEVQARSSDRHRDEHVSIRRSHTKPRMDTSELAYQIRREADTFLAEYDMTLGRFCKMACVSRSFMDTKNLRTETASKIRTFIERHKTISVFD